MAGGEYERIVMFWRRLLPQGRSSRRVPRSGMAARVTAGLRQDGFIAGEYQG
jgi:hypothetical protein